MREDFQVKMQKLIYTYYNSVREALNKVMVENLELNEFQIVPTHAGACYLITKTENETREIQRPDRKDRDMGA